MQRVCILISSCEKYRSLAEFTRAQLDRFWPGHPPIFFCGLESSVASAEFLPLRNDPADWMAVARSASGDLLQRGFDKCYLILDDHPPLDPCHVEHLNQTLPTLMDGLSASFINLHGWGQHRPRQGAVLDARTFHLEQPAHGYLWKFALHPGLWKLQAFADLLDLLLSNPDLRERTCWKFERRAGDAAAQLPPHLRDSSYRVRGTQMAARPFRRLFALFRTAELFAFDVLRFLIRIIAGQPARDRFDARWLGAYHFYDGPFPLFWSGVMKKGGLNPDFVFFSRLHRRHASLAEIQRVLPQ